MELQTIGSLMDGKGFSLQRKAWEIEHIIRNIPIKEEQEKFKNKYMEITENYHENKENRFKKGYYWRVQSYFKYEALRVELESNGYVAISQIADLTVYSNPNLKKEDIDKIDTKFAELSLQINNIGNLFSNIKLTKSSEQLKEYVSSKWAEAVVSRALFDVKHDRYESLDKLIRDNNNFSIIENYIKNSELSSNKEEFENLSLYITKYKNEQADNIKKR